MGKAFVILFDEGQGIGVSAIFTNRAVAERSLLVLEAEARAMVKPGDAADAYWLASAEFNPSLVILPSGRVFGVGVNVTTEPDAT